MASLILILLGLGGAVGLVISVLSYLGESLLTFLLRRLPPEPRANLLLAWGLLPLVAGLAAMAAVVAPSALAAMGLVADHCLPHGDYHRPTCLLHPGTPLRVPGAGSLLALIATVLLSWLVYQVRRLERASRLGRTLCALSHGEGRESARILETAEPLAATVGLIRPVSLLSRGLLEALPPAQDAAVQAHEAAHRQRRDPLRLALARMGAGLHFPSTARTLLQELRLATEQSADEQAAQAIGDRTQVAEALVQAARLQSRTLEGPGFTEGPLAARVQTLLEAPSDKPARPGHLLAPVSGLALGLLAVSPQIHHALETLLGQVAE